MKGCHCFHQSHRLPLNFLACPNLFGNLSTLHNYGRELAHAHDTAQGTAGELAWLMKQSCLQDQVTSGTSQCVSSGKPSRICIALLTRCPALASFDSSGSKTPNSEIFLQDQQRRWTQCHIILFLLILQVNLQFTGDACEIEGGTDVKDLCGALEQHLKIRICFLKM